jgi:hypothetical protein
MTHLTPRLVASLAALTMIIPLAAGTVSAVERQQIAEDAAATVSSNPRIIVSGSTVESRNELQAALGAFRDAGLELPDLTIRFSVDVADCGGHQGRFRDSIIPWEIAICSNNPAVYQHELAHAWERANLTDDQRIAFMELRGHAIWSSPDVPWIERGSEGVAFVIQQGLADVPLSPVLSIEARSRLNAYEFLTGAPAPRLSRWMALRDVPCDDRPTPLSRNLRDESDLKC